MKKVIRASAGTGKTYRLSLEYIISLLKGENFEKILVMTFTRKATAEIRQRILEQLKEILDGNQELIDNIKRLEPNLDINFKILNNQYIDILQNKDKIKIYTIDGFLNSIFKKAIAPFLNIYSYEMIDDNQNDELVEMVLLQIINSPRHFAKLKEFFSRNMERDIDNYIKLIKSILYERWKFMLINPQKREKKSETNYIFYLEEILIKLKEVIILKGKDSEPIEKFLNKKFQNYITLQNIKEKEKYVLDNASLFFDNNFWNGNKTKGKKVEGLVNEMKDLYYEFKKNIAVYFYNTEMIGYENDIFDFTNKIIKIYDDIKLKEKKFTHTDISSFVYKYFYNTELKLIENGKITQYFYDLIGETITTTFIDEFQDTSILQWKILKPILDNSSNIIIVGDAKQSIYGWRGGEKKLFEDLNKIIDAPVETLGTSYRSNYEIINFTNNFFGNINENWEYENVKSLKSKSGGFIETFFTGTELNDSIQEEIAITIKDKIKNYKTVGIIARKNSELKEIVKELEKLNIPYVSESSFSIISHMAIKPIYYLLKYLVNNDYFYLIHFLRSDILKVNERNFKYLITKKEEIENHLNYAENDDKLDDNLKQILGFVKRLKGFSYHNLSKHIIEDFGLLQKFNKSSDLKNIYYFFELMKKFNNLNDFLEYIKKYKDTEELKQRALNEIDAVKLMTIHKSKGLEFETQFFYWDISSRKPPVNNKLKFYVKFDKNYESITEYLLTNSKYNKYLEYLDLDFYSLEQEQEKMEELNNMYVALTRPKHNLFFYIDSSAKKAESFDQTAKNSERYNMYREAILNGMGNEINSMMDLTKKDYWIGDFKEKKIEEKKIEKVELSNFSDYFENKKISAQKLARIANNKKIKMTVKKEFNRKIGLAIHYYLENIKYNSIKEKELSKKLTLQKYGNMFSREMMKNVFNRANTFLEENERFFRNEWEVFTEYELQNDSGQVFRVDRLVVNHTKKEIWILDYKTGITMDMAQLENYKNILIKKGITDYEINLKFLLIDI